MLTKLDNPVWYALSESQKFVAIDYGQVRFYQPDFTPFGAFICLENMEQCLEKQAELSSPFLLVGEKPKLPSSLIVESELVGLQMLLSQKIEQLIQDPITKIEAEHLPDLLDLVAIAYPEYFRKKTASLGSYYGIYKKNQLVAITGERMQLDEYIEVSGVITHPDHTRKGYAKQLIAHTANQIFLQGKTPFLHVSKNNLGAIKLYESLGFRIRREMRFWKVIKK